MVTQIRSEQLQYTFWTSTILDQYPIRCTNNHIGNDSVNIAIETEKLNRALLIDWEERCLNNVKYLV